MNKAGSECTRALCADRTSKKARQQTDRPTQHTEAAAHFAFSLILHVRLHIIHVEQGSASESVEMGRPREPRPQGRDGKRETPALATYEYEKERESGTLHYIIN